MMRRLEREFKRHVTDHDKIRSKNTRLFIATLNRFLEKEIPRLLTLEGEELDDAVRVVSGLMQGLEDAGLVKVVQQIRVAHADELSAISGSFSIAGFEKSFSGADKTLINELIEHDYTKVTNLITPYVDDISSTVMRAVVGGERPNIRAIVSRSTDLIESQVETEVNTLLAGFSRSMTFRKADELGVTLFIYVGPDDKVTRQFCKGLLEDRSPAIYSLAEIRKMKNDNDLPVMEYGGGYNCRHRWNAVSEDLAKELGWHGGN